MAASIRALVIRSSDPERCAQFWGSLLGWSREGWTLLANGAAPFDLTFIHSDVRKQGLGQIHFHLTSNDAVQSASVAAALTFGASHLDVGQLPEEGHVVLADTDGNEFCVIEAGNRWLADAGFFGELAADGTREVGVFWSEAVGWPLVWDENGETAISPPEGGFKIAWGGPPLNERYGPNRMYFDVVVDDLEAEVDRLTCLGATKVTATDACAVMADPDGNEFHVAVAQPPVPG